jgi:hypothetical protein
MHIKNIKYLIIILFGAFIGYLPHFSSSEKFYFIMLFTVATEIIFKTIEWFFERK